MNALDGAVRFREEHPGVLIAGGIVGVVAGAGLISFGVNHAIPLIAFVGALLAGAGALAIGRLERIAVDVDGEGGLDRGGRNGRRIALHRPRRRGDGRAVFVTLAIYMGGIALVALYRSFRDGPRSSGKPSASGSPSHGGIPSGYSTPISTRSAVRQAARRPTVENVVWGVRDGLEMRAFDYRRPTEDEIRYSCAMVRIPDEWPSLLVRRHSPLDVARNAAGLRRIEFELESSTGALRFVGRSQASLGGGRSEDDRLAARVGSGARVPVPGRLAPRVDASVAAG